MPNADAAGRGESGQGGAAGSPAGCGSTTALSFASSVLSAAVPVDDNLDSVLVCGVAGQMTLLKELTSNSDEDGSGWVTLGDTLNYTITATNTGSVMLSNVIVSDTRIMPSSTVCASVPQGEAFELTGSYQVTHQADVDAGEVLNTATATSNEAPPVDDVVTTPLAQSPSMSMVKVLVDAPDPIMVGSVLTYSVTGTNTGNVTLTDVTIDDAMIDPSQTTCASLAPGEQCVLTGTYSVSQADVNAGEIVNVGTAGSNETPPEDDTVVVTLGPPPVVMPVPGLGQPARLALILLMLLVAAGVMLRLPSASAGRLM